MTQDGTGSGGGSEGSEYALVVEGGTEFLAPRGSALQNLRGPARRAPVFYNPAMALSRDLHVAVVERLGAEAGRPLSLWDALAATGVRGLRAAHETGRVGTLLGTDAHPSAVDLMARNFERAIPGRGVARLAEARDVPSEAPFDLVDLDPYGTPRPFLQGAIAALRPGGVLAVTATDLMVLAGPERATCEQRYGGRPLRNYLCREAALRILLACISREAARRGRRLHPLVSYVRDHHARAYLRLEPAPAGEEPPIVSVPFEGYGGPPLRQGLKGGPLWWGPLHDASFVGALTEPTSAARPREWGPWIGLIQEEARVPTPFYYESGEVGKSLGLREQPPLARVLGGLREAGWKASRTPFEPSGWKTDAPWSAVERVVRGSASAPAAPSPRTPGSARSSAPP